MITKRAAIIARQERKLLGYHKGLNSWFFAENTSRNLLEPFDKKARPDTTQPHKGAV